MSQPYFQSPIRMALNSVALFFLGLLLSAFSSKHPEMAELGHRVISEVVTPIQSLVGFADRSTSHIWTSYVSLVGVKQENDELKNRLVTLEAENSRLLEFESENVRLRKLMSLSTDLEIHGVVANVIGYDPSTWVKSISIDKGTEDGVVKGQSVIEGKGVVGQIINSSRHSAKILLLNDHASAVDAIIQRTRARGVIEGSGVSLARMNYVLEREDVRIGDRVITSGFDQVFPKGLFIGVVSDVDPPSRRLFRRIEVEPAVDFLKLENVFVITSIKNEIAEAKGDS